MSLCLFSSTCAPWMQLQSPFQESLSSLQRAAVLSGMQLASSCLMCEFCHHP